MEEVEPLGKTRQGERLVILTKLLCKDVLTVISASQVVTDVLIYTIEVQVT